MFKGSTPKASFDNLTRVLLSRAMKFHSPTPPTAPKMHFTMPKLGFPASVSFKAAAEKPVNLPKADMNSPFAGKE